MLDLDPSKIPPEQFEEWRKERTRRPFEIQNTNGQNGRYLSRSQMARRIGATPAMWIKWEKHGVPEGPKAAVIREFVEHDAKGVIEFEDAPKRWVKAVAHVVGGYPTLAKEIGVATNTVRNWGHKGAGRHMGGGPLIRFLFKDMDLDPVKKLHDRPDRPMTPTSIRDIRKRYEEGTYQKVLASEYDVDIATISNIVNRKTYKDVS